MKKHALQATALLLVSGLLYAQSPAMEVEVANPAQRKPVGLDAAPQEIREFLLKAEEADKISDPLERCLRFPDPPGSQWPAGHAAARCQRNFGPAIKLSTLKPMLLQGDLQGLQAMFETHLQKHYGDAHSELIHASLGQFAADEESDALSQLWLAKAPDSAYAHSARGHHLLAMAWKARGTKFAAETPAENLLRMESLTREAIQSHRRALEIEPRLMPSVVQLVNAAMLTSDDALLRWAVKEGNKLDKLCSDFLTAQLLNAKPRWGGSYAEMEKLISAFAPHIAERPQLASHLLDIHVDMADDLRRNKQYEELIRLLQPVVNVSSYSDVHEHLAISRNIIGGDANRWQALVHYLVAARFMPEDAFDDRARGRLLVTLAKRPEWARKYLLRAVAQEPDQANGHYLLAASYFNSKQYAEAEPGYLKAMQDPELRKPALYELTKAMFEGGYSEKARRYLDQYNKEYATDPQGWYLKASMLGRRLSKQSEADEVIVANEKFLELTTGTTDPQLLRLREGAQYYLSSVRSIRPKLKP